MGASWKEIICSQKKQIIFFKREPINHFKNNLPHPKCFETGSMTGILEILRWESLKKRRRDSRLIFLYKGSKGAASAPIDDLIPPIRHRRNHHSLIFQTLAARTRPSCSKLTTSLVNDSLKFALSDTQICWNFLLKKMWVAFAVQKLLTFFQQKISEYCILNLLKQLTKWPLTSLLS